jgi:hypothetical protein
MRSMRAVAKWLGPVVGIWIVACSSGSGGGGSVSADQACSDLGNAICQRLNSCSAAFVTSNYGDVATCAMRVNASCGQSIAANGTGLTPANRETCAMALPGASCEDLVDNNFPSACQAVAGHLANGTACTDSSQCQSTYCNLGTDGTCGACGAARQGAGGTCHRNDDCETGSTCKSGTCVTPVKAGGTCDGTHPCQTTLSCKAGVCGTPDAAGMPCSMGTCDAVAGLYCSSGAKAVCTAYGLAKAGEPCGAVNGVLTICAGGGHCSLNVGTTMGTCEAAAADGAACNDMTGPSCLAPAVCGATSKVCTLPNPANCH